jgi:nucleoid-associated protein YgaU
MKLLILMFLMMGLVSCSGSKSAGDLEQAEAGIELADSDEFSEEGDSDDVVAENTSDDMGMSAESTPTSPTIDSMGDVASYTVQKNETLMMISFKLYGDYSKWRMLSEKNGGITSIKEGMALSYQKPSEEFVWSPAGNPYLVKSGDTLGVVSNKTYGETKFWKEIWSNNKPLIKDPNKIYAGFTIYTPLIEGRDVANSDLNDL